MTRSESNLPYLQHSETARFKKWNVRTTKTRPIPFRENKLYAHISWFVKTQNVHFTARLQSACKKNDISSLHANKELSYCEPIKELCLTRRTVKNSNANSLRSAMINISCYFISFNAKNSRHLR